MELTIDAKERLEEVAKLIEEEPLRFDMEDWVVTDPAEIASLSKKNMLPQCGTVCCIAAWVVAQDLKRKGETVTPAVLDEIVLSDEASIILGLDMKQEDRLYYRTCWPYKFRILADQLESQTPEYAANGAARIRHFIDTNGDE